MGHDSLVTAIFAIALTVFFGLPLTFLIFAAWLYYAHPELL